MPILVIDLEATCCDLGTIPPEQMEIIEIGAVWAKHTGEIIDTFQHFVKPVIRPVLTSFCKSLTQIEQSYIDSASTWPKIARELTEFSFQYSEHQWSSWGAYDYRQIERECARHGILNPLIKLEHINLKANFAKKRKIKQVGMATALKIVGLQLNGDHHRALSDAKNIAQLLPWSLDFNFAKSQEFNH